LDEVVMNVPDVAKRIQRWGLGVVFVSLLFLGASVLLVCVLVALTILPTSILRLNGKLQQLVLDCLWLGVSGPIIWLVGWILARFANNKD
jgi:hypothetical protein